ncbi:MAG TPA: YCF48-related protein [Ignavibacteria bacterium]|nr:YCF48-related protein [Ignavibacteria bacterium]
MKRFIALTTLLLFVFAVNAFSQTWTAQTSGVTTSLNCVSAVDANIGWIGGNGGVILKTVNGGANWTNVANGTVGTADIYAICALSASVCLVSTSPANTFVYRTSDGGTTWTQVFTQVGGFIDDIRFKDANNGIMYGDPVSARWSIWRTTNAGVTWDSAGCFLPQAASEAGWNNAMFVNGNTVYFGTNSTKVYKSTNFGATGSWTSGATTGSANSYSVAFNGNIGFSGQTVAVKSTDAGSTYASVTLPGSGTCYSFNTIPGTNKFWYNRAAIIYYSGDNGANFTSQFTGTGTYQAMSMVLSGSVIRGWSVTNTGLITMYNEPYVQVPTGTWTEQTSGLTTVLYSVSAVNDDVAWVCGASGKVLRTTNKGQNWTNVSGTIPTTLALYNIFAWDANLAIVTGVSGANTSIYQTSNGGTTWTLANTHAGFGDDLYMSSATDAYFIGDPIAGNWDLLKSTNGGLNWATWATLPTTNTSGTYNNAAYFQGTQVWFESVGLSTIHYSSNMGANWTSQTISLGEITAIYFTSATRGLAGGASTTPGLLSTTNSGTNWSSITSPYPTSSISGIVGAGSTWWVSQQGLGISISTNDGTSFSTAYTAPAGNFYHLTKSRAGATLWAVRSNGGISRYGAPIIGINPVTGTTPVDYILSQNYPNPFNPVTKINFALPKSGLVSMKIYDILGQEVATLVNEVKNAGNYSVDFDASKLSSGIYFYKISVNDFTDVKKMTLIK